MTRTILILGSGGWGTALALVAHRNGHRVRIYGPLPEEIQAIRDAGENTIYLPGISLPPDLHWTSDPADAFDGAEGALVVIPSAFVESTLPALRPHLPPGIRLCSATKGFDPHSGQRISQTLSQGLGGLPCSVLSGPSHAEEVARGVPTAVTVASASAGEAAWWQETLGGDVFRIYTSSDPVGVELGGALKNIVALAAGVSDGIGFGDNTKAALLTRGLAEIQRLGEALGADPRTFAGLSGVGDLVVTCASRLSRNRQVGERLGRGETLADIQKSMKQVAEGVWNCAIARDLALQHGVEAPILEEVFQVVHAGKDPAAAVRSLLQRDLKPETPR